MSRQLHLVSTRVAEDGHTTDVPDEGEIVLENETELVEALKTLAPWIDGIAVSTCRERETRALSTVVMIGFPLYHILSFARRLARLQTLAEVFVDHPIDVQPMPRAMRRAMIEAFT